MIEGTGLRLAGVVVAAGLLLGGMGACDTGGNPAGLVGGGGGGGGGNPAALIGVWQGSFDDPTFGPAFVEMILQSDGSFSQQTAYQAGSLITIFGAYRVLPTEAVLHLDTAGGIPSDYLGTPITYPDETHSYTFVDNNTLVLQNIINGFTLTYFRAG